MKLLVTSLLFASLAFSAVPIEAPPDVSAVVIAAGDSTVVSVYSVKRDIVFFEVTIERYEGQKEVVRVYPGPNSSADYAIFRLPESDIRLVRITEIIDPLRALYKF